MRCRRIAQPKNHRVDPQTSKRLHGSRAKVWAALAVGLALIGALLCLPRQGSKPMRPLRVLVLDTSASLTRTRPDLPSHYRALLREETQAAREGGEDFALVRLGPTVEVWRSTGPAPEANWEGESAWWTHGWEPLDARGVPAVGTDWQGLGRWLLEQFEAGRPGTVQLATDGEGRSAQDFAFVAELAREGIPVQAKTLPAPTRPDVALLAGRAPASIPVGSSMRVILDVGWRGPAPSREIRVQARWNGGAGWTAWSSLAAWRAEPSQGGGGKGVGFSQAWMRKRLSVDFEPFSAGWYDLEVRLACAEDRTPENDVWRSTLVVGDPYLVLVDGDPRALSVLAAEGSVLQGGTPAGESGALILRPVPDGESEPWERWLPRADAVYTLGRAPTALPGAALEAFVRGGGAWVFQAEWEGLEGWGSLPSPGTHDVGRLLPLEVEYGDGDPRDVCLLVDGSGSMEGLGWSQVQRACEALMRGLPVQDGFTLHLFTRDLLPAALRFAPLPAEATAAVREQARLDRARARDALLTTRVPGGPTDILRSLRSLASQRRASQRTLAVLITDGHESGAIPQDPEEVRGALTRAGIELRIVATGDNPNVAFLERLLEPGGALTLATDWERLPEWLQREVLGDALRSEAEMPVVASSTHGPHGVEVPALNEPATLDRYLRTRPRPGAQILWSALEGEPILAAIRRGAGWVYASPVGAGGRWMAEQRSSLRTVLTQASAWGRRAQGEGPALVAVEGEVHLHGAPPGPFALWVYPGPGEVLGGGRRGQASAGDGPASDGAAIRLATEPLPSRYGLHPLGNRRVLGAPAQVRYAELRLAGEAAEVPGGDSSGQPGRWLRLSWPATVHPEFRPPAARGPFDPSSAPPVRAIPPAASLGPHPWGPPLLGIALGVLLGLTWILGSGVKESRS